MEYIIAVEFLVIVVLYTKIRGQRKHINRLKGGLIKS